MELVSHYSQHFVQRSECLFKDSLHLFYIMRFIEMFLRKSLCTMLLQYLREMLLHKTFPANILSIIIPIAIQPLTKIISAFCKINFALTLTRLKNKSVFVTVKSLIYFICLASNTAGKSVRFRDIHPYFKPFLAAFSRTYHSF